MNIFDQISIKIIQEQELIIGPVAWNEARKVPGLIVSADKKVSLSGDSKIIIDKLVTQYERLFGRASHEVCKEAAHDLISQLPKDEIPASLQ